MNPIRWVTILCNDLEPQRGMWVSLYLSRLTGNGRFLPIKAQTVRWSNPMQITGQVECN